MSDRAVGWATRLAAMAALAAASMLLSGCAALVVGGAVTAVAVVEDRRTPGTILDDQTIETRAVLRVKNRYADQVHVNITSFNKHILISGEAATEAIRSGVESEVRAVAPNAARVYNEMVVGPRPTLMSITNDTRLTALVKSRFVPDRRFQANHVKVVTESGTVYLMGLVTRAEGDAAAEVAASTAGVRRVVKLFEFLD